MEKYIAWVPNTLGKLSFSYIRSDDTFSFEKEDTLVSIRDVFSCDAYIETPFIGGFYLERFFNFILYIIQIAIFFFLNLIIKLFSSTGINIIPEKNILTNGIRRFIFKNKMRTIGAEVITDFRYCLIVNKVRMDGGFFESINGRVYSLPLKSFGLWSYEQKGFYLRDIEVLLKDKIEKHEKFIFDKELFPSYFFKKSYFFCDVEVHRSGICFLSNLEKNKEQQSQKKDLEIATDERIFQQIFYFIRDCFHSHKHHSDNHDTLSSAYKYDALSIDIEKCQYKAVWIKNIIYGFVRHSIMNKNKGNYFDAIGVMTYVDSFKRIVERGFTETYPKLECIDPCNSTKAIDSTEICANGKFTNKNFTIVHYVTSHIDVFKDNLEVLAKRASFQSSVKTGFVNKIFSNFTIGFFALIGLATLVNNQLETVAILKEILKNPISIICIVALFFIFLDNLYSQGPRHSYTYKNMALSSFYANLKGIHLNNDDLRMSHRGKMLTFFIVSLIKSYLVPASLFVDYIITDLPFRIFNYIKMIIKYPNVKNY